MTDAEGDEVTSGGEAPAGAPEREAPASAAECPRCGHASGRRGGLPPRYCAACGRRLPGVSAKVRHTFAPPPPASMAAIAALLLGLCSFIPLVGLFLGVLAIAVGGIAQDRIRHSGGQLGGGGLAGAGIVFGLIGAIIQAFLCFSTG